MILALRVEQHLLEDDKPMLFDQSNLLTYCQQRAPCSTAIDLWPTTFRLASDERASQEWSRARLASTFCVADETKDE